MAFSYRWKYVPAKAVEILIISSHVAVFIGESMYMSRPFVGAMSDTDNVLQVKEFTYQGCVVKSPVQALTVS